MNMLRLYLPHIALVVVLVLVVAVGWQWLTGLGYRAQASALQVQLAQVQADLTLCKTTAASRLSQIEAQNAAVVEARAQGEDRRRAALAARDEALQALDDTRDRYNRLRKDWPQDCVSAVQRVRQELGL